MLSAKVILHLLTYIFLFYGNLIYAKVCQNIKIQFFDPLCQNGDSKVAQICFPGNHIGDKQNEITEVTDLIDGFDCTDIEYTCKEGHTVISTIETDFKVLNAPVFFVGKSEILSKFWSGSLSDDNQRRLRFGFPGKIHNIFKWRSKTPGLTREVIGRVIDEDERPLNALVGRRTEESFAQKRALFDQGNYHQSCLNFIDMGSHLTDRFIKYKKVFVAANVLSATIQSIASIITVSKNSRRKLLASNDNLEDVCSGAYNMATAVESLRGSSGLVISGYCNGRATSPKLKIHHSTCVD